MPEASKKLSPYTILTGTFVLFLGPFLLVQLFPAQLDTVMEKSAYVVFHNVAEFFSIMVSLCVFSVGWYTYDHSKDQRALLLGTAFLVVGILDFMHAMANAAMPAFITPNSTNKSTQFWITARLFDASALLWSAFLDPDRRRPWITKASVLAAAVVVIAGVFTAVTFFPGYLPSTAVAGAGLTPLKRYLELLVIALLLCSWVAYWKKLRRTGDRVNLYFLSAFIICIFSESAFASYRVGFDTYNILGHLYKIVAFYLIYKGLFVSAIRKPYLHLSEANEKLRRLNRLYTVLSETNKAIGRAGDHQSLFREICRVAIEHGGFRMAWVGVVEEDSTRVKPVAWSGHTDGYLERVTVTVDEGEPEGRGPTGCAIREGELIVCGDIENDPRLAPWREEARERGYRSSAAIPLKSGSVTAALTLYAEETEYFNQLADLLPQMALDISLALDNLERDAQRRAAEIALQDETLERLRVMETLHEKDQMLIQQSRLAAMGEMLSNIAHQWRQPLNNIGLMVQEMLMNYECGEFSKEYLEARVGSVMAVICHMSTTIDDFRNFLRADKEKVAFDVDRVVISTVSLVEESFRNQQIEIAVDAASVPAVFGYPNEFSQVILNLLANARDAFDRAGAHPRRVGISIRSEGEKVVIAIADNAGGIPEEILDRIFDPYFTTKGPDQGTGIGLYMSKAIIDNSMKGRLKVRNTGGGAEFRIELLTRPEAPVPAPGDGPASPASS